MLYGYVIQIESNEKNQDMRNYILEHTIFTDRQTLLNKISEIVNENFQDGYELDTILDESDFYDMVICFKKDDLEIDYTIIKVKII